MTEIEIGQNPQGRWHLAVAGHDVAAIVTGFTVTHSAEPHRTTLTVDMEPQGFAELTAQDADVRVGAPTYQALVELGWTPPGQQANGSRIPALALAYLGELRTDLEDLIAKGGPTIGYNAGVRAAIGVVESLARGAGVDLSPAASDGHQETNGAAPDTQDPSTSELASEALSDPAVTLAFLATGDAATQYATSLAQPVIPRPARMVIASTVVRRLREAGLLLDEPETVRKVQAVKDVWQAFGPMIKAAYQHLATAGLIIETRDVTASVPDAYTAIGAKLYGRQCSACYLAGHDRCQQPDVHCTGPADKWPARGDRLAALEGELDAAWRLLRDDSPISGRTPDEDEGESLPEALAARLEADTERYVDLSRRFDAARERVRLAKHALVHTGYFKPTEVSEEIAPRIAELASAYKQMIDDAGQETSSWREMAVARDKTLDRVHAALDRLLLWAKATGDGAASEETANGFREAADLIMAALAKGDDSSPVVRPGVDDLQEVICHELIEINEREWRQAGGRLLPPEKFGEMAMHAAYAVRRHLARPEPSAPADTAGQGLAMEIAQRLTDTFYIGPESGRASQVQMNLRYANVIVELVGGEIADATTALAAKVSRARVTASEWAAYTNADAVASDRNVAGWLIKKECGETILSALEEDRADLDVPAREALARLRWHVRGLRDDLGSHVRDLLRTDTATPCEDIEKHEANRIAAVVSKLSTIVEGEAIVPLPGEDAVDALLRVSRLRDEMMTRAGEIEDGDREHPAFAAGLRYAADWLTKAMSGK